MSPEQETCKNQHCIIESAFYPCLESPIKRDTEALIQHGFEGYGVVFVNLLNDPGQRIQLSNEIQPLIKKYNWQKHNGAYLKVVNLLASGKKGEMVNKSYQRTKQISHDLANDGIFNSEPSRFSVIFDPIATNINDMRKGQS